MEVGLYFGVGCGGDVGDYTDRTQGHADVARSYDYNILSPVIVSSYSDTDLGGD
jgi:hypothetical protein